MATLNNIIGSCMCGNPIVVNATAMTMELKDTDILSFHRLIIKVQVGVSNYETMLFATSVSSEETIDVDISSAMRAVADSLEYSVGQTSYSTISYKVSAYDEYRLNDKTHTSDETSEMTGTAFNGTFSDLERLKAGSTKSVSRWTRKPKTSPQIVCVGETVPYCTSTGTSIPPVGHGVSASEAIATEGLQQINNDFSVYALPAAQRNDDRYEFRFINGLGVLDSFSCYALAEFDAEMESTEYALTTLETFGSMSHGIVHKTDDKDQIKLTSGPLTKDWQDWFIHEFLKAEYMWVYLRGADLWVRCNVSPSDTIKGTNRAKTDITSIGFTCKLDINGSMNSNLMA